MAARGHVMLDCNQSIALVTPFFGRLSEGVKSCLLSKARVRSYSRGETICLQGEPAESLKIVMNGWVKLFRVGVGGDEAILATLSSGQSFDEAAALQQGECRASADAVSQCSVMHLDLGLIQNCENGFTEVSRAVLSETTGHLDAMMGHVEGLKVKTGAQRLADYLVCLSEAQKDALDLELPFEKNILAGKLGMKPESLSRTFAHLKKFGVECRMKQVRIRDVATLRAYAEECAA